MLRLISVSLLAMVLLGGGLLGMGAAPRTPLQQRDDAERRWKAGAPPDYRVLVQLEQTGGPCLQEIEVRQGRALNVKRDTCGPSWLARLTVPRLFDLSERLEQPSDCFPSSLHCVCQRVRVGQVRYDDQLGYPKVIEWRREVRPNWQHGDFWKRALMTGRLPQCNLRSFDTRVVVIALDPIT